MKKILMILTSHKEMMDTESSTGVWLGEFTDPYYEFIDQGYEVTLASPEGGEPPVDPMSKITEHITPANRRFKSDKKTQQLFKHTVKFQQLKAGDYDALFFPGGHGPLWDLATDEQCGQLILDFLDQQKPVAAVCHGPAALIKAAEMRPGLLKGKKMTGFTNTEETLALRNDNIPYQLETRLKELGADFHTAIVPYTSHTEIDGLLITGQNPLSAGPTAELLINVLEGKTAKMEY